MQQASKVVMNANTSPSFSVGMPSLGPSAPIVFIAVEDANTREALTEISRAMGWRSRELPSARAFLSEPEDTVPSCLVLDVSVPWYGDLRFHERLTAERKDTPVVCVTGVADILMTVRLMKAGVVDVLPKPVRPDLLVDAVRNGLVRSEAGLRERTALGRLRQSYESLSRRERDVMRLVVSGLLNKQAGGELGISEITVKAHRGRVMRKMNARSFADLVNMADRLKLGATAHAEPA
ncbi:response regulator transcription factor [Dankookia sp. GCM10030260]|uniref:response regulator transcription factor n=1 Tax=Dankookia sp. GCM10030260 TaxID=3273390 RepID=UPI00360A0D0F